MKKEVFVSGSKRKLLFEFIYHLSVLMKITGLRNINFCFTAIYTGTNTQGVHFIKRLLISCFCYLDALVHTSCVYDHFPLENIFTVITMKAPY